MKRASLDQLDLALDQPAESEPTKLCTGCGVRHPLSAFLPTRFTTDGLTDSCLDAIKARAAQDRAAREARLAEAQATAPDTKSCKVCRKVKPLAEFGRHWLAKDGHVKTCRACQKSGRAKPKQRTAEQAARLRELAAEPYQRVRNRLAVRSWSERNPHAVAARRVVRRAVLAGELVPAPECQVANCRDRKVQAHHPNYSRELEVLWVCASHHRRIHLGYRPQLDPGVDRKLLRVPKEGNDGRKKASSRKAQKARR